MEYLLAWVYMQIPLKYYITVYEKWKIKPVFNISYSWYTLWLVVPHVVHDIHVRLIFKHHMCATYSALLILLLNQLNCPGDCSVDHSLLIDLMNLYVNTHFVTNAGRF